MKRTTLISASLLLAFAGCTCGQGWRPNILSRLNDRIHGVSNVGAPCDAGCRGALPAAGCEACGTTSSNYGGYDGQIIDSAEGASVGYNLGPSAVYNSPTYPAAQAAQSVRMGTEQITPKAAK
jgi:hypothetical protein